MTVRIVGQPATLLSQSTLAITEEGTGAYSARLDRPPTGNVRIRATRSGGVIGVRTPGVSWAADLSLNFTTSTWNTAQTVKVNAPHDANTVDASTSITLAIV